MDYLLFIAHLPLITYIPFLYFFCKENRRKSTVGILEDRVKLLEDMYQIVQKDLVLYRTRIDALEFDHKI